MITHLKVGGVIYTVEEAPHLIADQDVWGYISMRDAKIQIDSTLGDERKQQTLIHELTHAIFLEAGYKDQEEDMINRVSIVLHQVLQDNPNLLQPLVNVTHVEINNPLTSEEIRELMKNSALTTIQS